MVAKIKTYSREHIEQALVESLHVSDFLDKLEIPKRGVNFKWYEKFLTDNGYDYSHFKKGYRKNYVSHFSMLDVMENRKKFSTSNLSKYLKEFGCMNQCDICKLEKYRGRKINFVLDHINGNPDDNRFGNLRFLCPNCNSQTDTYCAKNKKQYHLYEDTVLEREEQLAEIRKQFILYFDNLPSRNSKYIGEKIVEDFKNGLTVKEINKKHSLKNGCLSILQKRGLKNKGVKAEKTKNIDVDIFKKQVWEKPMTVLAKEYGCSDNALRRFSKKHGIKLTPPGYWAAKETRYKVPDRDYLKSSKIYDYSKKQMLEFVWSKSINQLRRELGVNDETIKKYCAELGVPLPPSGYWNYSESQRRKIKMEILGKK